MKKTVYLQNRKGEWKSFKFKTTKDIRKILEGIGDYAEIGRLVTMRRSVTMRRLVTKHNSKNPHYILSVQNIQSIIMGIKKYV